MLEENNVFQMSGPLNLCEQWYLPCEPPDSQECRESADCWVQVQMLQGACERATPISQFGLLAQSAAEEYWAERWRKF